MALDSVLSPLTYSYNKIKDYFSVPGKTGSMRDYALRNYIDSDLQKKLFEGKNEDEVQDVYKTLEEKISSRISYHQKFLGRLTNKAAKGAGLAAIINDSYHFLKGTPFGDFGLYQAFLVGGKAILELPTLYNYMKDTKDIYGAIEWAASKALAWFLPVIGPSLDYNVMTRIIRKRAIKEAVDELLTEKGLYKMKVPLYRRVLDRVRRVAGDYLPTPQPALQPA